MSKFKLPTDKGVLNLNGEWLWCVEGFKKGYKFIPINYEVWELQDGNYACKITEHHQLSNFTVEIEEMGNVCETMEDVYAFFGQGRLAQELYSNIGEIPV